MSESRNRLELYDTLERRTKVVDSPQGEPFRFYCCGPTVYGPAHIGNFRTFVLQDVFRRVIELTGLEVKHVRNITDVDDKTIRDSQAAGQGLKEFTTHWTEKFHADCKALNLLEPHVEPSAIGHIDQQVAMIESLMEKGHAYQGTDGSVYFRIQSFPQYGRLSHLDERELQLGSAQTANDADEYEKDSLADFVLWKARKETDGENFWPSPWGEGRPGWHLECSAMSHEYLGENFDLHSGGVDLCFPHHENEIAQSEAATGAPMCQHWFHTTHLLVDGGKMSKSLKNFYQLADIEEKGHTAMELRYVLISGLYRQSLNFTLDSLQAAHQALGRLARAERELRESAGIDAEAPTPDYSTLNSTAPGPFAEAWQALLNDLNTPDAIGKIFSALKTIGDHDATEAWKGYHFVLAALGLELPAEEKADVPAEILDLAEQRWQAKQAKEWAASDALRDQITAAGWRIEDSKGGYEVVPV